MAEEVVVKDNLSEAMISAGAELTRRLVEDRWPLSASLWLYLPDLNKWRLILASPNVADQGPREAYKQINQALTKLTSLVVSLQDITVVEPDDSLISALRTAVRTGDALTGIRFSRNVINGQFIDDAYIYRLN